MTVLLNIKYLQFKLGTMKIAVLSILCVLNRCPNRKLIKRFWLKNEFSSITQNNKGRNSHFCADISTKALDHCLVNLHYSYSSLGVKNSKLLQIYSDKDV